MSDASSSTPPASPSIPPASPSTPPASPSIPPASPSIPPASPSTVEVGTELPSIDQVSNLTTSVMYAGASGDFNPLHYDQAFAGQVSPTGGIIAHGMFSMGLASRVLTAFAGGPEQVLEVQVRFTRPWPLGTTSTFAGKVTAIDDGVATVALTGTNESGDRILKGTGRIRL
jgi:acyl dehydratase